MAKKQLDNRVKESVKHDDEKLSKKSKGRDRDEPDEAFVVRHTIPASLPGDAVFRFKGKAPAIAGKDYERDGNDLVWLRPLPIYTKISAHDPGDNSVLWEWSAYHGDTE